jgi:hypothetical protein
MEKTVRRKTELMPGMISTASLALSLGASRSNGDFKIKVEWTG